MERLHQKIRDNRQGGGGVTKLLIEINNDGEKCGECEYKLPSQWSNVTFCKIFKDIKATGFGNMFENKRCQECIQAEKDAQKEEWDLK